MLNCFGFVITIHTWNSNWLNWNQTRVSAYVFWVKVLTHNLTTRVIQHHTGSELTHSINVWVTSASTNPPSLEFPDYRKFIDEYTSESVRETEHRLSASHECKHAVELSSPELLERWQNVFTTHNTKPFCKCAVCKNEHLQCHTL